MGGYYPGETISIRITTRDVNKELMDLDQDYPKISIYDPNGSQYGSTSSATRVSLGTYEFDWNVPLSYSYLYGTWIFKIEAKKGSYVKKKKMSFLVEQF